MMIFKLLIYILSYLFPKSKNTILFGAWHGKRYSDNSMYLFDFLRQRTDLECYWVTRDHRVYNSLKDKNIPALRTNTVASWITHLRAGWIIYSSGKIDLESYLTAGSKKIFLWHGAPMKKILYDDSKHFNRTSWKIKRVFFPFMDELSFDYTLSTSPEFDEIIMRSFRCSKDQLLPYGYPRNDRFGKDDFKLKTLVRSDVKIGYFPTFRDADPSFTVFSEEQEFIYNHWVKFNSKFSLTWFSSMHFASTGGIVPNEIKALSNDAFFDLNGVIDEFDIVITDYSGCYWDSLLANRFTILFWPDLDDYVHLSRELNFTAKDFQSPIAYSWEELYSIIEKYLVDNGENNRTHFNKYNNGNSCANILELILENVNR